MNRAQRRAAEHLARKMAKKTIVSEPQPGATQPKPETEPPAVPIAKPISEAQLNANRLNAKESTGPKTEAGKAICSHNAVKTALTGQTVLLPTDDVAKYEELGKLFIAKHQPVGSEEERLVQSLINAEWRLMRIPSLELGIYAVGREALADSVPAHLLEAEVHLKYERHLRNLSLQENRIRRFREHDLKALQQLQAARAEAEAKRQPKAVKTPQPPPPPENGSEFLAPGIPSETPFKSAA